MPWFYHQLGLHDTDHGLAVLPNRHRYEGTLFSNRTGLSTCYINLAFHKSYSKHYHIINLKINYVQSNCERLHEFSYFGKPLSFYLHWKLAQGASHRNALMKLVTVWLPVGMELSSEVNRFLHELVGYVYSFSDMSGQIHGCWQGELGYSVDDGDGSGRNYWHILEYQILYPRRHLVATQISESSFIVFKQSSCLLSTKEYITHRCRILTANAFTFTPVALCSFYSEQ